MSERNGGGLMRDVPVWGAVTVVVSLLSLAYTVLFVSLWIALKGCS